ncbi:hypothetical protein [Fundidesulfovibrio butyratiphilus]
MSDRSSFALKRRLGVILLLALLVGGCATLHTGHLRRTPWSEGKQQIATKFFRFEYQGIPLSEQYGVKGQAFPLRENLPPWADAVETLSIVVYLSDDEGKVLAKDQKSYLPRRLGQTGIPFDFFLKCKTLPGQKLFVSFGYRSMFVASKPPKTPTGQHGGGNISGQYVFFASEGATLKQ